MSNGCQKCPIVRQLMALVKRSDFVSMALGGCSGGLLVSAAVVLLLLPAHYYLPELSITPDLPPPGREYAEKSPNFAGFDFALQLPPLDLFVAATILCISLVTYLCEWIQRKMMERRIIKLNQYLSANVLRLRERDTQRERQEDALRVTRAATAEYGLLLHLLLQRHRRADDTDNYVTSSAYKHET